MRAARLAAGFAAAAVGVALLGRPDPSAPVQAPAPAVAATPKATATPAPRRIETSGPRCFGAASRDPLKPCRNRALRLRVSPTPRQAQIPPTGHCHWIGQILGKVVCAFGVAPQQATRTVALVGDSHAGMWRRPLDRVARAYRWHGVHLGHASCPLSTAVRDLPEPDRTHCARWKQQVFAWFGQHPEVSVLFVSELSGGSSVVPSGGRSRFATAVAGYADAWRALPRTVRHIVVIRDTPKARGTTAGCVERAMARRRPAGPACAVPRGDALDADPAASAAARAGGRRVQLVSLTSVFCGPRACLPVIGGALVHKDTTHLTPTFARTLGAPLGRRLAPLMRHWALP
jgi:hypothetical protein